MPAELLVLVPVLSNGVNFVITIGLLLPVSIALGVNVGWALVFLPLLVLIQLLLTLGISILVAVADVFYQDIQQIVSYVLTAAFFLTPIFYSRSVVPGNLRFLVDFNPLAGLLLAYQNVFYKGVPPDPRGLLTAAAFGTMAMVVGLAYFNNARDTLEEYV